MKALFTMALLALSLVAAHGQAAPVRNWYPFGGVIVAVDQQAGTFSFKRKVGERVFHLDARSSITIGGKPAKLSQVRVGNYAHGKLRTRLPDQLEEVVYSAAIEPQAPPKKPVRRRAQ